MQNNEVVLSQILSNASLPSFHQVYESGLNSRKTHKCCVYIADESKYCVRLNSIQAFMDVNRDVSIPHMDSFYSILVSSGIESSVTIQMCAGYW